MDTEEILNGVYSNVIDEDESLELLLLYVDKEHINKLKIILRLIYNGSLKPSSAKDIINKLLNKNTIDSDNIIKSERNLNYRKQRRAARPLEMDEYKKIIRLCKDGFDYEDEKGVTHIFRPNKQLAMAFILQSNLGLRISDVLKLKPATFKNEKLEIIEKKTGKLQYRKINKNLKELIYEYAIDNNIKSNEYLIKVKVRAIQKQLNLIVNYLELSNISSHSFRKLFGVTVYNKTNGNIELLKELFNHSNIAITQRYIKVSQNEIDRVSESIDFTEDIL